MLILGYESVIEISVYTDDQLPLTATFAAHVAPYPLSVSNPQTLAQLTSVEVITTAANTDPDIEGDFVAEIAITFPADTTRDWTAKQIITDVVRTDIAAPQHLGWQLEINPLFPVTKVE